MQFGVITVSDLVTEVFVSVKLQKKIKIKSVGVMKVSVLLMIWPPSSERSLCSATGQQEVIKLFW